MWRNRNATAMAVIIALSLGTGNLTADFRDKGLSFTSIFIAFNVRIKIEQAGIFGVGNQMPILPHNALRLRPPRVM